MLMIGETNIILTNQKFTFHNISQFPSVSRCPVWSQQKETECSGILRDIHLDIIVNFVHHPRSQYAKVCIGSYEMCMLVPSFFITFNKPGQKINFTKISGDIGSISPRCPELWFKLHKYEFIMNNIYFYVLVTNIYSNCHYSNFQFLSNDLNFERETPNNRKINHSAFCLNFSAISQEFFKWKITLICVNLLMYAIILIHTYMHTQNVCTPPSPHTHICTYTQWKVAIMAVRINVTETYKTCYL